MLADLHVPDAPKGMLVFFHGYKGFKDWGCWNAVAEWFAAHGWAFLKANFSHNGTTPEHPADFVDPAAFAANTYSMEVSDGMAIVSFAVQHLAKWGNEAAPLVLIGHSRGGGIAALVAAQHPSVSRLVLWAAVSDFEARFPFGKALEAWKQSGSYAVVNARTGQTLHHNYSFYTDFQTHAEALNIREAMHRFEREVLVVHAGDDEAVHVSEALRLGRWNAQSTVKVLASGGHTFGAKHPWELAVLPEALEDVCTSSLAFIEA